MFLLLAFIKCKLNLIIIKTIKTFKITFNCLFKEKNKCSHYTGVGINIPNHSLLMLVKN